MKHIQMCFTHDFTGLLESLINMQYLNNSPNTSLQLLFLINRFSCLHMPSQNNNTLLSTFLFFADIE